MAAVKKEIAGWDDNQTYELIDIEEKIRGAPLGELFTRKKGSVL